MQKKLLALALGAALFVGYMPAAEAVSLGNISNIGRTRTYNRSVYTNSAINQAINKAVNTMDDKKITFQSLPQSAAEVGPSTNAHQVAAYTVAALARYESSPEDAIAMLNALLGPRPVNGADKQFLADRFRGKTYLMRSYFVGATPQNNYTPSTPYAVKVTMNSHSKDQDGYIRFLIPCGGADSPRPMTVRQKGSTGEWFLWDYKGLLSGIRTPAADDPWA